VDEFDHLLAREPNDGISLAMKAAALTEIGRYAEAAHVAAKITDRFPDQGHGWLVHAGALRAAGETRAAILAYRHCLGLDPACAEAWLGLANLKTYRFGADDISAMETGLARPELAPENRAKLAFALGKAREDGGDDAGAFEAYVVGNAIEAPRRAFDPDQTSAYVRRCKALFTPAFFAERAGWGASAADPIFIVGLPRSGSTLVEQILASHGSIEGTRELPDLPMIASTVRAYPEGLADLPRQVFGPLGEDYLSRTRAYRRLGRPRFIDKTPKNFLHIGFIRLALPNARIIDVRRHPLDCGVSIFKQHFGTGFNSAFDLDHIGRYYADYVDLMAHFDLAAPGAVHRVIYEDLVADTEGEVRRLLAWLGQDFDPSCLRFFETRRAVDTPSSEQVRQPIFASAIGSWRRYEPWLGPLKVALGPALEGWRSA
jgi:tetratricopeptide (TPR) repeat protein